MCISWNEVVHKHDFNLLINQSPPLLLASPTHKIANKTMFILLTQDFDTLIGQWNWKCTMCKDYFVQSQTRKLQQTQFFSYCKKNNFKFLFHEHMQNITIKSSLFKQSNSCHCGIYVIPQGEKNIQWGVTSLSLDNYKKKTIFHPCPILFPTNLVSQNNSIVSCGELEEYHKFIL